MPQTTQTLIGQFNPFAVMFFVLFVISTLGITYWAAKRTSTTKDFYAAGRSVTGFQNGLALAGDYMSAASFLGIAGLVSTKGYQIVREQMSAFLGNEAHVESFPEALSYLPRPEQFRQGPESYLEHVQRVKRAVRVPVIASLNGTTLCGWLNHARLLEQAGADALELNVYQLATDPHESGDEIEETTLEMLRALKGTLAIPVAVKLSPFYTSLSHFAGRLVDAGARGLIVFNRFYQPDIDVEALEVTHSLRLSDSSELQLRLRWLAALSGRATCSLAVSGGVHTAIDAIKSVMCGAHAVQTVSALLTHGPEHLAKIRYGMQAWLEENEYESLRQAQGSMNLSRCPDPKAYERGNYIHVLQSWWGNGEV